MVNDSLLKELQNVKEKYPNLQHENINNNILLKGELDFFLKDPQSNKPPIYDSYYVEIKIDSKFPEEIPIVKEIGGRIKENKYEHILTDRKLCLGLPSELGRLLKKYPTIEGFIEKILKPNLYAYSYFEKYDLMPWGDRQRGTEGIISHYVELFKTKDLYIILRLLSGIIDRIYDGNSICPCGRKLKLSDCHGETLLELNKLPKKFLNYEYQLMLLGYFIYYKKPF